LPCGATVLHRNIVAVIPSGAIVRDLHESTQTMQSNAGLVRSIPAGRPARRTQICSSDASASEKVPHELPRPSLLADFDRAESPSRRRQSVGSQIGMGGHSIGEVPAGKLTFPSGPIFPLLTRFRDTWNTREARNDRFACGWRLWRVPGGTVSRIPGLFLVSLFVVLGCAGVPSHPPRHMAEGPNRLRPAVIQEDHKTRLRLPGRSARAVAEPAESAVIQVSWVEDPPAVEPQSGVSSRRVPRPPAVEHAPSKPGRTQTASKGGDNPESALAQLARYLRQPSAAEVPRELRLNGQGNSRNGISDEEESPIVFRSISAD
jgi:hypothetical protein